MLLKIAGISRSVYYYYINKKDIDEKNKYIIEKLKEIYKVLSVKKENILHTKVL